jgi:hypothetical protein
MIFNWLNKKAEQTQRYEADRFIVSLKGGDVGLIDAVHGSAMFWSVFLEKQGADVYEMEQWILGRLLFPTELGKLIKDQQKQGTTSAVTGLMAWLFSARALLYPDLRLGGREIWEQFNRSTYEAETIASQSCKLMGYPTISIDRTRVPSGLEKLNH